MKPLCVFVATRLEDVPAGCLRYASVDGSVPGAVVTWDHHVTGEAINLDAMPKVISPDRLDGLDGVGTTLADTDALASVVAVLLQGSIPVQVRSVLEAASYRCDHLKKHPGVSAEDDLLGRELHGYVSDRLATAGADRSSRFGSLCHEVLEAVVRGDALPFDRSTEERNLARVAKLDAAGRIRRGQRVGIVDLRGEGGVAVEALYTRIIEPVALIVGDHVNGGRRYTVGVNPGAEHGPTTLEPCLIALAALEFSHGAPALRAEPTPGAENWGGRRTVFGSPWNYGSRLDIDEVVQVFEALL
ncbi:MAG: hypothetical protein WCI05_05220, partial [Myxococcales bacterium]